MNEQRLESGFIGEGVINPMRVTIFYIPVRYPTFVQQRVDNALKEWYE